MTETVMFPVLDQPIIPIDANVDVEDLPPIDDPFFYGWREVPQRTNGTTEWFLQPLTLADVLHPQWDDHIMQNQEHFAVCKDLFDGLESHLDHEPQTQLLHDTLIDWEVAHVKPMCPDIAVIRAVQHRFPKGIFYVERSCGHVDLVVEVTSPNTRKVDVDEERPANKVQRYAQVGVPYYIIVDDAKRDEGQSPALFVYRLGNRNKYERLAPDNRGWYWIGVVELWIGPHQDWVAWYDADGNKLGTHIEDNKARKLAEEQARVEANARKLAEEQARTEANARKLAEEQARTEANARKLAEEQARIETNTRKLAEERIKELEAILRTAGLG